MNFYAYLHASSTRRSAGCCARSGTPADPRSLRSRTVIARISDHGEMGLSHGGLRQKMFNAYEETIRVPLVFSNPLLFPAAVKTDAPASLVDLVPTLLVARRRAALERDARRGGSERRPGGRGAAGPRGRRRRGRGARRRARRRAGARPASTCSSPTTTTRRARRARRRRDSRTACAASAPGASSTPRTSTLPGAPGPNTSSTTWRRIRSRSATCSSGTPRGRGRPGRPRAPAPAGDAARRVRGDGHARTRALSAGDEAALVARPGRAARAGRAVGRPGFGRHRPCRNSARPRARVCHGRAVIEDFETLLPGVRARDPRFDGWFFTAVTSTGHLLPAELPGDDPQARERALLPVGRGGAAGRLPGVQALPARRRARLAGVEHARRRRRAGDAADRRRRRRPRRRARPRRRGSATACASCSACSSPSSARGRSRSPARSAPRRRASLIETTDAADDRGRVRRRVREHPAVQRHRARGVRAHADRAARGARSAAPRRRGRAGAPATLRLPFRRPLCPENLFGHLAATAVPGRRGGPRRRPTGARSGCPTGPAIVELDARGRSRRLPRCASTDLRDLDAADRALPLAARPRRRSRGGRRAARPPIRRSRRSSPRAPGRRVPRTVDGAELAVRAVLGQQISTAAARTHAAALAAGTARRSRSRRRADPPVSRARGAHPRRAERTGAKGADAPGARPRARGRAPRARPGGRPQDGARALEELPGVGPWTREVVAMRALGDPDAFPVSDLGVRRGAEALGLPSARGRCARTRRSGSRGGRTRSSTCGPRRRIRSIAGRRRPGSPAPRDRPGGSLGPRGGATFRPGPV